MEATPQGSLPDGTAQQNILALKTGAIGRTKKGGGFGLPSTHLVEGGGDGSIPPPIGYPEPPASPGPTVLAPPAAGRHLHAARRRVQRSAEEGVEGGGEQPREQAFA